MLDCETAPVIDVSAAQMLDQLSADLGREHVQLLVAKSVGQVRDMLRASGVLQDLGGLYPTIDEAVAAARTAHPTSGIDRPASGPEV